MSYQYIYPIYPQSGNIPHLQQMSNNFAQVQSTYAQNPYTASFYNQSVVYPFNPLYTPDVPKNYRLLEQFNSPSGDKVNLFQLSNGHKVAIMPTKGKATIVKTFLDGGSMNEDDKLRGISHCIEHCLFKGSSKLKDGDVFKLTSLMGASTNASTDYAQTDYYITAPYMSEKLLHINDLHVVYKTDLETVCAVNGLSISLENSNTPQHSQKSPCENQA